MRCPSCDAADLRVVDSRATSGGDAIRRRRSCESCGYRFNTYERVERPQVLVVKKNGEREQFEREKLLEGILVALHRRPVSAQRIDHFLRSLDAYFTEHNIREVTSVELGERVVEFLREVDHIAFVRFASVYREFQDIGALLREVASLVGEGGQA